MNELRFGHRVIWQGYGDDEYRRGVFLNRATPTAHRVMEDDTLEIYVVMDYAVELDPNATEFLTGDEVEFSMDGDDWSSGIYGHRDISNDSHRKYNGLYWTYCRYPKEKEKVNINVNQKTPKGAAIGYLRSLTPEELAEIINEATKK